MRRFSAARYTVLSVCTLASCWHLVLIFLRFCLFVFNQKLLYYNARWDLAYKFFKYKLEVFTYMLFWSVEFIYVGQMYKCFLKEIIPFPKNLGDQVTGVAMFIYKYIKMPHWWGCYRIRRKKMQFRNNNQCYLKLEISPVSFFRDQNENIDCTPLQNIKYYGKCCVGSFLEIQMLTALLSLFLSTCIQTQTVTHKVT